MKLLIVKIGYIEFSVPEGALPFVPQFRLIESSYITNTGYVYWHDDADIEVRFMDANKLLPGKPEKNPPAMVGVPSVPALEQEVIPAPIEDGSDGLRAARDLVAEGGSFPTISFVGAIGAAL